eukprot:920012-Prymnesium_polylepis.1
MASQNGHLECVKFLIDQKADVTLRDQHGRTLVDVANLNGDGDDLYEERVKWTVEKALNSAQQVIAGRNALPELEYKGAGDEGTAPAPEALPSLGEPSSGAASGGEQSHQVQAAPQEEDLADIDDDTTSARLPLHGPGDGARA